MSGLPETRKLWITPLSPVHMGTDEDYTPTNYVIEDSALYEFDHRALDNLPPLERDKLNSILNGKANERMLKAVQSLFYRNRQWLIPAAVNVTPVSKEVEQLYTTRIGKAANIEHGGKEALNKLEIEKAAYTPATRRLFLPGSGIKGAIRTALLDDINNNSPLPHWLKDNNARDGSRIAKQANAKLQRTLFDGSFEADPMRLIQVGDCHWRGSEAINSAEVLFAINRKKRAVIKNGAEVISRAEDKNLYQLLECASPLRLRAFQGSINITSTDGLNQHADKLPKQRFSFSDIAAACNGFYFPIFEQESGLLAQRGFIDEQWHHTVTSLLQDEALKEKIANNEVFLLRVGRHSGADSVTLNGLRRIKIMKGKGQKPDWKKEAQTLWLATGNKSDRSNLRPFGWLLIETTAMDETPLAWPQAEKLASENAQTMQAWLSDVRSKQAAMRQRLEARKVKDRQEAEARAAQQAEEEKRRAEEEARKKAEEEKRQEQLKAMVPIEREVAEFATVLEAIKALESGKWEGDKQQEAAGYIKTRMQKEKVWREKSTKKRPEKDKPYQQTLRVLKFLEQEKP